MLAYLMNLSTHVLLGQPVEFHADFWFVLACGGACLLIASAAAWIPARRASRLADRPRVTIRVARPLPAVGRGSRVASTRRRRQSDAKAKFMIL